MPTFVDDDEDRGYRNVTGRALVEFAATDEFTLRARGWGATGRTEYTAQTFGDPPYAPVSQDFENSVYSLEGEYRAQDGFGVRANVSYALDDIDQLQPGFGPAEFDYARTGRTTIDVQVDLANIGTHSLTFGAQHSYENTSAQSFGTVFDEDTDVTQVFVQDQFEIGRLNVAPRARQRRSRDLRQRAHLERRVRRRRSAAARASRSPAARRSARPTAPIASVSAATPISIPRSPNRSRSRCVRS